MFLRKAAAFGLIYPGREVTWAQGAGGGFPEAKDQPWKTLQGVAQGRSRSPTCYKVCAATMAKFREASTALVARWRFRLQPSPDSSLPAPSSTPNKAWSGEGGCSTKEGLVELAGPRVCFGPCPQLVASSGIYRQKESGEMQEDLPP